MIIPKLLWCSNHRSDTIGKVKRFPPRYVYDYELEYYTSGTGMVVVNSVDVPVGRGRVMFRKPGEYVQGIPPYDCIFIGLDLTCSRDIIDDYDLESEKTYQPTVTDECINKIATITDIGNDSEYRELFYEIFKENLRPNCASELIITSDVLKILSLLYMDNKMDNSITITSPHYYKTQLAKKYIEDNIFNKFNLTKIATYIGYSPNYLHKIFVENEGSTPLEVYNKLKIEKCSELLIKSNISIVEISYECGFSSPAYFSYYFSKQTGISPSDYRRKYTFYL